MQGNAPSSPAGGGGSADGLSIACPFQPRRLRKAELQICDSILESLPGAHQFLLKIEIGAMKVIHLRASKGRVKV